MSGLSLIDVWYRRLPRYLFVEDQLVDQPVLELGCGQGLGADFLAERGASRVVGVDADERHILKARARYKRSNLSFEVLEGPGLPFDDGEFGVVLVPEGAEVVRDPEQLSAIRRVLRPDGFCLVATPNGDLEDPDPDGLSYYDLIEALEAVFPSVTMVAQTPMLAFTFVDFVASAEDLEVHLDDSLAHDLVDEVAYYVALCSVEPVAPEMFAITQVPFAPVARRVQHLIDAEPPEQIELGELREALAAERDERIRVSEANEEARQELLESQEVTRDLRADLAQADQERAGVLARLAELQQELAEMHVAVKLGDEREQEVSALKSQLGDATQAAEELRGRVGELQRERDDLQEAAERAAEAAAAVRAELDERSREADALRGREATLVASAAELEEATTRLGQLEQQQSELQQELSTERNRSGELAEGLERGRETLVAAERTLEEVRAELDRREWRVGELTAELARTAPLVEEGAVRIVELQAQLDRTRSSAEQQSVELQQALAGAQAAQGSQRQRIEELELTTSDVDGALQAQRQRVGELEHALSRAEGEAGSQRQRVGELDRALSELRQEQDRRAEAQTETSLARDEAVARIAQQQAQIAEAEQALRATLAQCESQESRLAEVEEKLADRQARLDNTQSALRDAGERVAEVERELALTHAGAEEQRARLAEAEEQRIRASERCASLTQELEEVRHSSDVQEERAEAAGAALEAAEDRERKLKVELERAVEQARALEGELHGSREQVNALQERLVERDEELEGQRQELEEVLRKLQSVERQRNDREHLLQELKKELAARQAECRSLDVRLTHASTRISEVESTVGQQRGLSEEQRARISAMEQELEAARRVASEADETAARLRGELEDAHREARGHEQRAGEAAEHVTRTARALEERSEELRQIQEEHREAQRELERAQQTVMQLDDVRRELAGQLEQRGVQGNTREAELAEQARDLIANLTRQQERADGLQDRLRAARDELAARDATLRAVQERLARLQADEQRQPRRLSEEDGAEKSRAAELEARLAALQQELAEEQDTRLEIERSLEGVERSMTELSDAGELAAQELETARAEAVAHAAEAASWRAKAEAQVAQREATRARTEALRVERTVSGEEQAAFAETVQRLKKELSLVRAQGDALSSERSRLLEEVSLASDARESVAAKLESAVQAHDVTAQGMELVIGRLEQERLRAEALDVEVRQLRERIQERSEFTVKVTREAAAEAQRARQYQRERESLSQRVEELKQALARSRVERAAGDPHEPSAGEEALTTAPGEGSPADPGVGDWDAQIQQGRLDELEEERAAIQRQLSERRLAMEELERRLESQARRLEELAAGADRHRLEMADREVALAEQAAWNAELETARDEALAQLAATLAARTDCESQLHEARERAAQHAAEVARLEGTLLKQQRQAAEQASAGVDRAELEELQRELDNRESQIEDLQAVLEVLKEERAKRSEEPPQLSSDLESKDSQSTLTGVGLAPEVLAAETAELTQVRNQKALLQALEQVRELERTCQLEEERLDLLGTSLGRLLQKADELQSKLESERLDVAEIEQQRQALADQAARVPQLELELELLRSDQASVRRLAETQHAAQTAERTERKVHELNNTIGEKEAEILLLHTKLDGIRKRVSRLTNNLDEALRAPPIPPEATQALLDRVKTELDQLRK